MNDKEEVLEPEFYCPTCSLRMTAIFYEKEDEAMNIFETKCPNDHKITLRVRKDLPVQNIIDQMDYLVTSKGGEVIYRD